VGRSVRRGWVVFVAMLPVSVILAGCVSTQTIAARARLVSARTLASQSATEVSRANPAVTVGRLALIRGQTGTAIVVPLRNNTASTLTDLPISVAIHTTRGDLNLNRSANLDYFESHIAVIAPHGTTDWVFTTRRRVTHGQAVAAVGFPELHITVAGDLPRIEVSSRGKARLTVSNRSTIPQYDLQVYVVAIRAGRDVGAGRADVTHLGTDATTTLNVTLIGAAKGAVLRLIALPTIFS
jgi:hypothetical protein